MIKEIKHNAHFGGNSKASNQIYVGLRQTHHVLDEKQKKSPQFTGIPFDPYGTISVLTAFKSPPPFVVALVVCPANPVGITVEQWASAPTVPGRRNGGKADVVCEPNIADVEARGDIAKHIIHNRVLDMLKHMKRSSSRVWVNNKQTRGKVEKRELQRETPLYFAKNHTERWRDLVKQGNVIRENPAKSHIQGKKVAQMATDTKSSSKYTPEGAPAVPWTPLLQLTFALGMLRIESKITLLCPEGVEGESEAEKNFWIKFFHMGLMPPNSLQTKLVRPKKYALLESMPFGKYASRQ
ncbi:hypothetical protein R3P38DRAFT_2804228 [Favolaschia claudopus]|uniref:Reverse transcriptase n=1 Tax=Favolaschia claudopus TaxID=2862362 RepID=A0AAV9ZQZ8_9AGAR